MKIIKYLKEVLESMLKIQTINSGSRTSGSILGKRKLDYTYIGFISSTERPPLSSPKLERNSGAKRDEGKAKK